MSRSVLDIVIRAVGNRVLTVNEARQKLGLDAMSACGAGGKHDCGFCHGITFDDRRGNCSACGGPREQIIHRKADPAWQSIWDLPDEKNVSLELTGSDLYVGGSFTSVSGLRQEMISGWFGNSWVHVGK